MKAVVIGGGPAGYVAALSLKRLGAEVLLIEREELGGTCLNKGCIPTKTIIHSLGLLEKIKNQKIINEINYPNISVDLQTLMQKKDNVVDTQKKGLLMLLKHSGVKIIKSEAELINPQTVFLKETSEKIQADRIIIATGSKPAKLPMLSFDGKKILSSDDLWNLKKIPESITIIGAGAIGCEFAWIFHLLGSKVTLIELMPKILPMEEEDISKEVEKLFKKRKIQFYTGVRIQDLKIFDNSVQITLSNEKILTSEIVLVSVGRAFNTDCIKTSEIKLGNKKEIIVNERMQTNIENIFAAGDVIGNWLLAHVAYKEGEIAAKNAMGDNKKMDYTVIPSTIFTVTEVASVGLKEADAIQKGFNVKKGIFPFRAIGKAHVVGEIEGFIKVIADKDSDIIVGAHVVGADASELIHELAMAVKFKIKINDLKELIHSHPTLSECIGEAIKDISGEAIHKIK
ncbi:MULTISPECIES: dihydrolipoyl dehydrogenase [Thermodesulfovibrio]|uniref:Dihydrolipoyl dehydrogenase n=2 Tax=Thermodesulfovibrio yellowstonii TaxID=28262 RepID=B5YKS0_THEYD|nr:MULTISPECIES: dihydrolipoyl dehydrogenase [Thermodesulfovibrio]ACI21245.1 dihydrolipoamide dehydrogenase [Thermodesulfovibrio yellowstonii DSM 11347]MDI6864224.1 dihydrolipoyl dehydrogenase [Thermodesulfovibrio yellowstonii]GLI53560.1 dihydrolipoyl dehydrogenase [Thermodesulfovibrio islandicus]